MRHCHICRLQGSVIKKLQIFAIIVRRQENEASSFSFAEGLESHCLVPIKPNAVYSVKMQLRILIQVWAKIKISRAASLTCPSCFFYALLSAPPPLFQCYYQDLFLDEKIPSMVMTRGRWWSWSRSRLIFHLFSFKESLENRVSLGWTDTNLRQRDSRIASSYVREKAIIVEVETV